jgi:hypothetical protein
MTEINLDRTDGLMTLVNERAKELREQPTFGDAWNDMNNKFAEIHPVVYRLMTDGYAPTDYQEVVFQWPHVAVEDETQIAYTRSPEHLLADRQTRTSIGKYVARHWPHLPDHMRRDFVASFTPAEYAIWDTKELIIAGAELGPTSCMNSASGSIPFRRQQDYPELMRWFTEGKPESNNVAWGSHPYIAYAPEHGWGIAIRLDVGDPIDVRARAIVHIPSKVFVRSFRKSAGYSNSDEKLEFWLAQQGYAHRSAWPLGLKLGKFEHPTSSCPVIVPYIDGDNRQLTDMGSYLMFERDGDYACANTDGTCDGYEEDEDEDEDGDYIGDCERCGDSVHEYSSNRLIVGRDCDSNVCGNCARHYTEVRGPNWRGRLFTYYVSDDDAVNVDGNDYDCNNLPDSIVITHDGNYGHTDNLVEIDGDYYDPSCDEVCCTKDGTWLMLDDCVEVDGAWYKDDDDAIVQCVDGEHRVRDECWEDAHSGEWYPNSVGSVEWNGEGPYHPETAAELQAEADEAAGQRELDLEINKEMEHE